MSFDDDGEEEKKIMGGKGLGEAEGWENFIVKAIFVYLCGFY